jgi:hypothetical protein
MHTQTKLAGIALGAVVVLAFCAVARADYVELTDGSVLEGTVLKTGDGYWVKDKDGETRKIAASDVKSTGKGSKGAAKASPAKPQAAVSAKPKTTAEAKPAAAKTPAAAKAPAATKAPSTEPSDDASTSSGTVVKSGRVTDYGTAERRANMVEVPMAAVAIWQEFIDSEPKEADLAKGKEQLAKWQKLADGGAEKIKGKWVGGDDRKAIVAKAQKLYQEGAALMKGSQTLQAVEKFKEAVAIYPNNFQAQFEIAYILLIQHNAKEAAKYLEAAQKIRPNSPEVMANLALI